MHSRVNFKKQLLAQATLVLLTLVLLSSAAFSRYGGSRYPTVVPGSVASNTKEPVSETARIADPTNQFVTYSNALSSSATAPLTAFPVGWTALAYTTATGNTIE